MVIREKKYRFRLKCLRDGEKVHTKQTPPQKDNPCGVSAFIISQASAPFPKGNTAVWDDLVYRDMSEGHNRFQWPGLTWLSP